MSIVINKKALNIKTNDKGMTGKVASHDEKQEFWIKYEGWEFMPGGRMKVNPDRRKIKSLRIKYWLEYEVIMIARLPRKLLWRKRETHKRQKVTGLDITPTQVFTSHPKLLQEER